MGNNQDVMNLEKHRIKASSEKIERWSARGAFHFIVLGATLGGIVLAGIGKTFFFFYEGEPFSENLAFAFIFSSIAGAISGLMFWIALRSVHQEITWTTESIEDTDSSGVLSKISRGLLTVGYAAFGTCGVVNSTESKFIGWFLAICCFAMVFLLSGWPNQVLPTNSKFGARMNLVMGLLLLLSSLTCIILLLY